MSEIKKFMFIDSEENALYEIPMSEQTFKKTQEDTVNFVIWSEASTKAFINLYIDFSEALNLGKITQKKLWEKISNKMKEMKYNVSGKQCQTKLASLKRMYKTIKDHNNKSGNDRKTWVYFDIMDKIFRKKPWISPLSTISSDVNYQSNDENEPPIPEKKKKTEKPMDRYLIMKEEERMDKRRQHDEKMKKLDKMNALLEIIARNAEKRLAD